MNVLIIFDHPYGASASENVPHQRSYSAALLAAVMRGLTTKGHKIDLIDLHTDGFDPIMSAEDLASWRQKKTNDPLVANYQHRLKTADHIIFPIWWESMPALTKGFLDKVFVKGIVYEETRPGHPFKCLIPNIKGVSLLTVMNTPTPIYRWIFGNPITKILFRGTFRKIGIRKNFHWYNYTGMPDRSLEERMKQLHRTEQRFAHL